MFLRRGRGHISFHYRTDHAFRPQKVDDEPSSAGGEVSGGRIAA
jgi:hypothetical protein